MVGVAFSPRTDVVSVVVGVVVDAAVGVVAVSMNVRCAVTFLQSGLLVFFSFSTSADNCLIIPFISCSSQLPDGTAASHHISFITSECSHQITKAPTLIKDVGRFVSNICSESRPQLIM